MKITINAAKCPQNHKCPAMAACPVGAIQQQHSYALPIVDEAACIGCEKCLRFCPKGAIEKTNG